jgi:hypothetical protein
MHQHPRHSARGTVGTFGSFCYDKELQPAGGNNSVVECDLAKVEVAGSNPVSRSNLRSRLQAEVAHHSAEGATVGLMMKPRATVGKPPSLPNRHDQTNRRAMIFNSGHNNPC